VSADPALSWLLESAEPGVLYLTRRDLLGESAFSTDVQHGAIVSALLDFEDLPPYQKWRGAHWRLVSLVELGLPAGHPVATAVCERVLDAWIAVRRQSPVSVIAGLPRRHASQEGNALAVACRLGMASDPRAGHLAEALCGWQWPDGGWNCDVHGTRRSSFHETLPALWGLIEHHRATNEPRSLEAVRRATELLLDHELFVASRTGEPIHPSFAKFHWPPYWHYDALQAMHVLRPLGVLGDPRCDRAFRLLETERQRNGRWRPGRRWWSVPASGARGNVEVADLGTIAPQMVTLNALRAIKARELARV
jgi:hypothetical protein